MAYFAQINENDEVVSVVVADRDFIDSGKLGDPTTFVETFIDGSQRRKYAGKGDIYDRTVDKFKPKKPYDSWTYDEVKDKWKAPKDKPTKAKDERLEWDEDKQKWNKIKDDSIWQQ